MQFTGLFVPASRKPPFQSSTNEPGIGPLNSVALAVIRDQLSVSSWLALGGVFEGLLYLAIGRTALALPVAVIFWRIMDAFLQANGYRHNPHMDGIIRNKFSAQLPDETGDFGDKPANGDVCVLQLGFGCNHPYGMLAPGFKEINDHFEKMMVDLEDNSEKWGIMGSSAWQSLGERNTSNEIMITFYFKSIQHIHDFAHGPVHRNGWNWWNKTVKEHPYLSIWHEVFRAPSGNWESIYVNSRPQGFSATRFKTIDKEGEAKWQRPIVDARKGLLRSSAGRMSRSGGDEHEKYGDNVYENYA